MDEQNAQNPSPSQKPEEMQEEVVEETVEVEETPAPAETHTQTTSSETPKGLVGQVKRVGAPISGKIGQLKSFIVECQRVLRVTKKPSREEYQTIVKISAIGMAIIGLLGFAIHAMKELLF